MKMRWRRKQRRKIPKSKSGDAQRDKALAMNYFLCYTKRKKLTWAFFESLGWPENDVIRARNRMRPVVSLTNLVRVVTWLREEMELTEDEVRQVVLESPIMMGHSVESLEERRAFFFRKRVGVPEVMQKEFLLKYPRMFTRPVEKSLVPMIYGMIADFGISDAVDLLKRYPSVFVRNTTEQLKLKLEMLQKLGFTGPDISRLVRAQDAGGPSQNVLCNFLDRRIPPLAKLLRKNGLTEREIVEAIITQVPILAIDLKEVEARLNFLLREMECTPREIGAFPACLKYPVEARLQRIAYVKKYGFGEGLGLAELLSPDEREWQAMKKQWRGVGQHPASAKPKKESTRAEELLAQWEEEIEEDPEVEELVKMEEEGLVAVDPIKFAPRRRRRKIPIPKVYNLYEQNRIRKPNDPDYTRKMLEKRLAVGLAIERGERPPKLGGELEPLSGDGVLGEGVAPSKGRRAIRVKKRGPPKKNKKPRKKKGKKPRKLPNTLFPGVERMF